MVVLYIRFPSVVKSIYSVLKLCGQKYSSCNRIVPFLWLFAFVFAARQQSCCRIPLFPLIVDVCPFGLVWNSIFFINLLMTFEQCFINVSFIYNIYIFLYFYTFFYRSRCKYKGQWWKYTFTSYSWNSTKAADTWSM